jgi:hypothetical protein
MERSVGSFEAKTDLPALLERVARITMVFSITVVEGRYSKQPLPLLSGEIHRGATTS